MFGKEPKYRYRQADLIYRIEKKGLVFWNYETHESTEDFAKRYIDRQLKEFRTPWVYYP